MTLRDRVAIITGAGRGLGAVFAAGLAEAGASIVVADIDADAAGAVAERVRDGGGMAMSCHVDVSDAESVEAMTRSACEAYGGIDILVNNAALYASLERRAFHEISADEFDRVLSVNVKGPWLTARAAFPSMRERGKGKIINISSSSTFLGANRLAHYVASKMGVIGLTRVLAREMGSYNICVNAIQPGMTDSQVNRSITPPERHVVEAAERSIKRVQVPADLMGTLLFLASDGSDFMTGQTLLVDGGRYFR
jgi:3-oxoacyl-[acyl-carrier protein] reductase